MMVIKTAEEEVNSFLDLPNNSFLTVSRTFFVDLASTLKEMIWIGNKTPTDIQELITLFKMGTVHLINHMEETPGVKLNPIQVPIPIRCLLKPPLIHRITKAQMAPTRQLILLNPRL